MDLPQVLCFICLSAPFSWTTYRDSNGSMCNSWIKPLRPLVLGGVWLTVAVPQSELKLGNTYRQIKLMLSILCLFWYAGNSSNIQLQYGKSFALWDEALIFCSIIFVFIAFLLKKIWMRAYNYCISTNRQWLEYFICPVNELCQVTLKIDWIVNLIIRAVKRPGLYIKTHFNFLHIHSMLSFIGKSYREIKKKIKLIGSTVHPLLFKDLKLLCYI